MRKKWLHGVFAMKWAELQTVIIITNNTNHERDKAKNE